MSNKLPYEGRHVRMQTGSTTIPAGTSGALTGHDVVFPVEFAVVPFVFVNAEVFDPAMYLVCAVARTKTGFQIKLRRVGASSNQSLPVTWTAIA